MFHLTPLQHDRFHGLNCRAIDAADGTVLDDGTCDAELPVYTTVARRLADMTDMTHTIWIHEGNSIQKADMVKLCAILIQSYVSEDRMIMKSKCSL